MKKSSKFGDGINKESFTSVPTVRVFRDSGLARLIYCRACIDWIDNNWDFALPTVSVTGDASFRILRHAVINELELTDGVWYSLVVVENLPVEEKNHILDESKNRFDFWFCNNMKISNSGSEW